MTDLCLNNYAMKFPAYVANFPAAAKSPAMANLACLQFNPLQKAVSCMLDATGHPPQTATEGIASASISIPEQALSSSCITVIIPTLWFQLFLFPGLIYDVLFCLTCLKIILQQLQPFSTWNTDPQGLYNVYNMGFH